MRRIGEILAELDDEGREIVTREMQDALKVYNTDWTKFLVLKDYEQVVKKLLSKAKTWYFMCAVHEVEKNGINPAMVKLSVTELKYWEKEEYIRVHTSYRKIKYTDVMVYISKSNMKEVMK